MDREVTPMELRRGCFDDADVAALRGVCEHVSRPGDANATHHFAPHRDAPRNAVEHALSQ